MVNKKERMKCVGVIGHDKWECECVFTYTTGRIKRMRREKYKSLGWCKVKTFRFIASPVLVLELTLKLIPITRWNRH